MEAFKYGMRQGMPRENITARFYKTFYYWNRAQATCSELQESGRYVLRRFQGTRAVVYDKVVDSVHDHRRPHARAQHTHNDTRGYSTTPSKPQHAAAATAAAAHVGRLGLGTGSAPVQVDLATHVRRLMRRIPHPVVVITSAEPAGDGGDEGPVEATFRGMTVSSFNTVALEPVPLVSFNVRVPSATYAAMTASSSFLAHFLVASPAGARIADAFARGGNADGGVFRALAGDDVRIFSGTGTNGAPLIAGPGVMQVLRCRMLAGKEIEVGDHRVIVAEAAGVLAQPGVDEALGDKAFGLMYCDRRYRGPGEEIDARPGSARKAFVAEESIQRTMGLNLRRGDEATL